MNEGKFWILESYNTYGSIQFCKEIYQPIFENSYEQRNNIYNKFKIKQYIQINLEKMIN